MRILTLPGVFQPRGDCWMLAAVMREHGLARGARVLDVFTGSGALAIAAARAGASGVTAVDLSRRAVLTARLNARLNGVHVRALRGDLFEPVAGERFDVILANPPYVPGDDVLPAHGAARAWEGGRDGRALLDRLCEHAPRHLAPGGTLLIVQSSLCGEAETLAALARRGLHAQTLARHRGPLGPLVRASAELLEARGLLAPGERTEELQAIAGRLPREARAEARPHAQPRPALT
jgi:release factor glutamine methyltransferase